MYNSSIHEKVNNCLKEVRKRTDFVPKVALVLGSGLGGYASTMQVESVLPYDEIPGFPVSTVDGHKGQFLFGYVGGVPIVCMQGRVHYYEGYAMSDVVLPIRLMRMMGAEYLILTNAAGGIQAGMQPGDLMLITDQIASFVPSPLIGANVDDWGVRFPDMSETYDKKLQQLARSCAENMGIILKEGVYLQTSGPQYESPSEIAMFRTLGADAVGMSTACEAIAARHMGMRILGLSCISNLACGISDKPLSHEEVKEAGDAAAPRFTALVTEIISRL